MKSACASPRSSNAMRPHPPTTAITPRLRTAVSLADVGCGVARGRNVPLWTAIAATLAAVGLLAVHLWLRPLPGIDALEGLSIDARFRARGPRAPTTDRVVIIGLDDDTRRQFPEVF